MHIVTYRHKGAIDSIVIPFFSDMISCISYVVNERRLQVADVEIMSVRPL